MEWLQELWSTSWAWIKERETLFTWIGILSFVTIIVSAVVGPIVVRRMPADYFLESSKETEAIRHQHPVLRWLFLILKNLIGGILVIGGILMLLTPGQGLITIVIGLLLMNFPGKRKLEIKLVSLKPINKAINWIRRRSNQPPLELPEPVAKNAS